MIGSVFLILCALSLLAVLLTVVGCAISAQLRIYFYPIDKYYEQRRHSQGYTDIEHISPELITFVLAVEDPRFFKHRGYNAEAMMWAMRRNIRTRKLEGASTITQQLIKNLYFKFDRSILRKIEELFLAPKIEKILTKNQILELYLNSIEFGNGCWGIQDASKFYFDTTPNLLTKNESVFLAALLAGPTYYNPLIYPQRFIVRRNKALVELIRHNLITEQEAEELKSAHPEDNLDESLTHREAPPEGRIFPKSNPFALRKAVRGWRRGL